MSKFNIGSKVIVRDGSKDDGRTGEIIGHGSRYPWRVQYNDNDSETELFTENELELITEPQLLTKEEALCLCIHGTKVMSADTNASTEHYMDFNGIHFEWHHGKHKGIVNSMPTKFKLWEPPKPKFTVDSFVVFEEDYVKIIAAEYKHGSHRYYVSKGTYVNCKEDCVIADESELTAV